MEKHYSTLAFVLLICGTNNSAFAAAEETQNGEVENSSTVTYEKTEFDKYSPVSLVDILERIPGVPDILNKDRGRGGNNQRGFGSSGDQILINGKRLSAKSSSVRDVLARTSASQVERIELIRGATDGLDVQSEGLVINVVLIDGASESSIFWKIGGTYMVGKDVSPEFEVSYKGKSGNLDYTFSVSGENKHGYFFRDDEFFNASGVKTGEKDLDGDYHFREIDLSSNLTYNFENGDIINLNGNYTPASFSNDQDHIETGDDAETLFWDFDEKFTKWEVGGDYSTTLNHLGKLKILFVRNGNRNNDYVTDRYDGTGTERYLYGKELVDFSTSEEIYRASLTKTITEGQSLEFGGEAALNHFNQKLDDFERDGLGDPLVISTTNNIKIKEKRYEIFAHHNWTISSKMVLQSSLTTEFSQIIADTILEEGNISREDDKFTFLKPRINFRYDLSPRNQLRLVVEKKVSQLEFFNYMTFFDQQTKELKFGNTSIRPSQTWDFSATYEHRFAKDAGTIEAEIFYRHYKDYISRIDFTEYEDFNGNSISSTAFFDLPPDQALRDDIDFTSKSGNVDKASAIGVTLKSNTRLAFIGIPDAQLGLTYEFEKRRFIDPFTLVSSNFTFKSDHTFKLNFRHDVTKWNMSYGFEAELKSNNQRTDIDYIWQWSPAREYELFIEYKLLKDIKLRLQAEQQRGTNQRATFTQFQDHRRFAQTKTRSEELHDRPHEIFVSLEGTF